MNEVLIRKAKKGDKDAFCRLMDENVQSMYKIAAAYLKNDEDVADAIQDTILSCYENLRSLRKNRYFKTWLIRILINKCKDVMQKNKLVTFMDQIPETPFHEEYETIECLQALENWIVNIVWLLFSTTWRNLISGKSVISWICQKTQ